jgi:hypothetical protein
MPFEEENIQDTCHEIVEYSNRRLADKLSDISSVENLVELRNDFEKRIRQYFKGVYLTNEEESRAYCLNLLHNLSTSAIHDIKINEVNDIHPTMMS